MILLQENLGFPFVVFVFLVKEFRKGLLKKLKGNFERKKKSQIPKQLRVGSWRKVSKLQLLT